jgi:hypothetical protein
MGCVQIFWTNAVEDHINLECTWCVRWRLRKCQAHSTPATVINPAEGCVLRTRVCKDGRKDSIAAHKVWQRAPEVYYQPSSSFSKPPVVQLPSARLLLCFWRIRHKSKSALFRIQVPRPHPQMGRPVPNKPQTSYFTTKWLCFRMTGKHGRLLVTAISRMQKKLSESVSCVHMLHSVRVLLSKGCTLLFGEIQLWFAGRMIVCLSRIAVEAKHCSRVFFLALLSFMCPTDFRLKHNVGSVYKNQHSSVSVCVDELRLFLCL